MKINRILEIVWLIAAIVALAVGVYQVVTGDIAENQTYLLFIVAILGFVMYYFRRKNRHLYERNKDKDKNNPPS